MKIFHLMKELHIYSVKILHLVERVKYLIIKNHIFFSIRLLVKKKKEFFTFFCMFGILLCVSLIN
jgi:hypothetical protein